MEPWSVVETRSGCLFQDNDSRMKLSVCVCAHTHCVLLSVYAYTSTLVSRASESENRLFLPTQAVFDEPGHQVAPSTRVVEFSD
jgi:hypothetical protein